MAAIDDLSGANAAPSPTRRDWHRVGWKLAQVVNLVVMVTLIAGLIFWPATALRIMWNVLIPILPASFLIAPQLWRGICPLATLNQWSGGMLGRRRLSGGMLVVANAVGILLLLLMVPARRFLFNEDGPVLAATIIAVATAAVILGGFFERRAGFCNAICPVLPVERIYGQHPLVKLDNRRCDRCTLCIPKGCLDVDPAKSLPQALGRATGQYSWLFTTYGIFAAILPGFIVGYYTTSNGPLSVAPSVYLWVVLCCATSWLATIVVVRCLRLMRAVSLALLAAAAVILYYWWAVPLIAHTISVPATWVFVGRGAALVLVALWLLRAWPHLGSTHRMVNSGAEDHASGTSAHRTALPVS